MMALLHPSGTLLNQPNTPWIKEVSSASFMKEVIVASNQQPVLVDFWAPGCEPCRQLTPVLEKLTNAAKGQWLLAKVNVEKNPQIANQLRVQSLPTVYLFKNEQPVDGFVGPMPEAEILQFLEVHVSQGLTAAEDDVKRIETAETLWQQGSAQQALALLLPFVQQQPTHIKAISLVIRSFCAVGYADKAKQFFEQLSVETKDNPEVLPLHTLLQLIVSGQEKDTLPQLEQKRIKTPQDLSVIYDLSLRQFAEGQFGKSMETLMHLIQINKEWPEARPTIIQMFAAIGHDHPLVHQCRRQLSSVLFT
ncbi:MAG: tetratricopeptide repeat protein [Alphaproteobacteria bacterium]